MNAVRIRLYGHLRALAGRESFELVAQEGEHVPHLLARWQAESKGCSNLILDDKGRLQGGAVIALDGQIVSIDELGARTCADVESIDIIPELAGGQGA